MLIEFNFENFMSFKKENSFSMVAAGNKELKETNTISYKNINVLKAAVIYGANASGKSNFVDAIDFFKNLANGNVDFDNLPYYKLDKLSENENIKFEVIFVDYNNPFHENESEYKYIEYIYQIEINSSGIKKEKLKCVPRDRIAILYEREENSIIKTGIYFTNKKVLDIVKPDSKKLFLTTLSDESIKGFKWAKEIRLYFNEMLTVFKPDFLKYEKRIKYNLDWKLINRKRLLDFLRIIDENIVDIEYKKIDYGNKIKLSVNENDNDSDFEDKLYFKHNVFFNNKEAGTTDFPIDIESYGTRKFLSTIYNIMLVLDHGGILIFDELDSSFHTLICYKIINMFYKNQVAGNYVQLIFTTHNTALMNPKLFRRDQIYFIEKNQYGESSMYSLYDLDLDIRTDYNYANNYLTGVFGAIPQFND
jgi:AAA15 family ATPase/GTPase